MSRYAVSDLHGQLNLLKQIKDYIREEDILYVLGDSGDRGPEPWKTLKACLDDPQIIYLMGNHDLLLIQAIQQVFKYTQYYYDWNLNTDGIPSYHLDDYKGLITNGGWETLNQWSEEPSYMQYYKKLCQLPIEITLSAADRKGLIYLSHAGFNPNEPRPQNTEDFVWDREHFCRVWKNPQGNKVIHGHTPMQAFELEYMNIKTKYEIKDGYCIYNNGAKINIDRGTYFTEETVLLNIDTLEGKVFKVEKENTNGA